MHRRTFLKAGLASVVAGAGASLRSTAAPATPPNILWISAEDISPDLGCYGDPYADTPNIDAFAQSAVRYDRAYSHSGVCAPSRSGIITGMYPTAIGTQHMRCSGIPPAEVKCFPEYLRAAGYFCTNNRKTDYQFDSPLSAWDENGNKAHWRHRDPEQPFFSVFNLVVCHESQVRSREPELLAQIEALGPRKHDPAKASVPPYHADTPATRGDWAQYYDIITLMDTQMGEIMAQLEADGLADDTIVWFWGDHGRGLTRCKRWLYESGTRIPLLVHVPEKYRDWVRPGDAGALAAGTNDDLVCFVDFAPTMLSLAGINIPEHMQGQAFLGQAEAPPREYIYGARDRMDEAYDLIRTVRDKQYRYFRNYMPYVTYAQRIDYMDEMPMLKDLRRLHAEGKLNADQERWFAPTKPLEELYDVEADPNELNNLAEDPTYREVLDRMRKAHIDWMADTGDTGLIPEPILDRMKWPDGQPATCAPPILSEADGSILASCITPGASLIYRWDDTPEKTWKLYTAPIAARKGRVLTAKANRIGFKDSAEVQPGKPTPETPPPPPFWGDSVKRDNLLAQLRDLRALDLRANESVPRYLDALKTEEPALRYWAIVALHRLVDAAHRTPDSEEAVHAHLNDESFTVRVAAAHALCASGKADEALPVLEAVLKEGIPSERHYAAVALAQLGEIARPAIPALEAAKGDKWRYAAAVAGQALDGLAH